MQANTLNVIQLGFSFFALFFSFNATSSILEFFLDEFVESGQTTKHAGYKSLAIIYATFFVSNLFSAPICHRLGTRYSMTLGGSAYVIYSMGFIFLNMPYLYIASVLVGLGASILWAAEGCYLARNSNYSLASRHSAIFWGILQSSVFSQVCSGLFLFLVFYFRDNKIDYSTVYVIFGVFIVCSLIGVLMLMSLRGAQSGLLQYAPKITTLAVASRLQYDHVEMTKSTIHLFISRRMLLFVLVFLYLGIEQSFIGPIYSTCIGFTLQLGPNNAQLVALNLMIQGIGQITGSIIFGMLNQRFGHVGRDRLVCLGTVTHLCVYLAVYLIFPSDSTLEKTLQVGQLESQAWIALMCGYVFGLADACWNTQISSFLITQFPEKSAEAFSLFKIFQTMASCSMFFFAPSLRLNEHIIILSAGCVIACVCFILAEHFIIDDNANFYRENRAQINYIHALAFQSKFMSIRSETFPSTPSSCSTNNECGQEEENKY